MGIYSQEGGMESSSIPNAIVQNLKWRKAQNVDRLLEEWNPPEVLRKYYPGGVFGYDKEGYPVFYDTIGTVDLKGLAQSAKRTDIVKYRAVWMLEKLVQKDMVEASRRKGCTVDEYSLIFDMDGIGVKHLWKPAIDTLSQILSVTEQNYPETLHIAYLVNAPRIFPIFFNLVKFFLSEDTKNKLRILSGNWKEELTNYIDSSQLPKHWGGNCKDSDGDECCRSKICMGGEVPKSYYIPKVNDEDLEEFTKVTVGRGSSEQLEYEVQEVGSVIRWQFHSEGNDIGFGVFRKTGEGHQRAAEMVEVVENTRVDCHMIQEEGSHTCEETGTYVVRFDNTYSWVRAKTVLHLIEVLPPVKENVDLHGAEAFQTHL